jgi:hypothetical protein
MLPSRDSIGSESSFSRAATARAALQPGPHRREDHRGDGQRHPAALEELQHVGGEQRRVDEQEPDEHWDRQRPAPFPAAHREHEHQHRGDQHGAGDGDAIGRCEIGRRLEGQHQRHHACELQPIDRRQVDLAEFARRCVQDAQSWTQAEQGGLLRH